MIIPQRSILTHRIMYLSVLVVLTTIYAEYIISISCLGNQSVLQEVLKIEKKHLGYTLFKTFSILHRHSQIYISRRLKKENMTGSHPPFLMTIYLNEGMSQNQLAETLHFNKGAVAKTVTQLENDGYIKRVADTKDRRVHRLYLTDRGKSTIKALMAIEKEWSAQLVDGFSEQEVQDLMDSLNKIISNVVIGKENRI